MTERTDILEEIKGLKAKATGTPWKLMGELSKNMTGVHAGAPSSPDSYCLFTLINDPADDGPMGEGGLLPETVQQWKRDAALIVALVNHSDELIERLERAEAALPMARLGQIVSVGWPEGDIDGGDLQDWMASCELIKQSEEPYDADKHPPIDDVEEGDTFFLFTEAYYKARAALKGEKL
jgi:hypothetical protein